MTGSSNSRVLILTLIHGTFSPRAKWTRPKSAFRKLLRHTLSELGYEVHFRRMRWGFLNNSPTARQKAGDRLRLKLKSQTTMHPDAKHFVIAHSHGGNVSLLALRDEALTAKISGVVTMGTPFLSFAPRDILPALMLFSVAVVVFAFHAVLDFNNWLLGAAGAWMAAILGSTTVVVLIWQYVMPRVLPPAFSAVSSYMAKVRREMLDAFRLVSLPGRKLLTVTIRGDEAASGLRASTFFGNLHAFLDFPAVYVLVFALNFFAWFSCGSFSGAHDLFNLNGRFAAQSCQIPGDFLLLQLLVALQNAFFAVVCWFAIVQMFGLLVSCVYILTLGPGRLATHLFLRLNINDFAACHGAFSVYRCRRPVRKVWLLHSYIYDSRAVTTTIAKWICDRASSEHGSKLFSEQQPRPPISIRERRLERWGILVRSAQRIFFIVIAIMGAGYIAGRYTDYERRGQEVRDNRLEAVGILRDYAHIRNEPQVMVAAGTAFSKRKNQVRQLRCGDKLFSFNGTNVSLRTIGADERDARDLVDAAVPRRVHAFRSVRNELLRCRPVDANGKDRKRLSDQGLMQCSALRTLAWTATGFGIGFESAFPNSSCGDGAIEKEMLRGEIWRVEEVFRRLNEWPI